MQALARKGAIEISRGTSRGIRLIDNAHDKPAARQAAPAASAGILQLNLPLLGRGRRRFAHPGAGTCRRQLHVDPSLFRSRPDFLLKVRGMSMRDAGILDGDLLAVKKADSAKNGQIVVARLGDDVTVKRYRKTGSLIELLPENPDFEPIEVQPGRDEFALEGVAVGLLRTWN